MVKGKVLIVHAFFDVIGGGEFLALNAARALRESGYDVTILTGTPIIRSKIESLHNINVAELKFIIKPPRVSNFLKRISRGKFTRLRRLIFYNEFFEEYVKRFKQEHEYDLAIDTQSNILAPVDIVYIHYPAVAEMLPVHKGLHWRVYNWLVKTYASRISRLGLPGRILTNSTWTAGQIYKAYNVVADVVYPPVDVEFFGVAASNDRRDKLIVTVSRFTVEKKLERIVDVAAKLRDYNFVLTGSTDEYSHVVLDEIKRRIREHGLDNVTLEPDLARSKLLGYLKNARYYLHSEFPEHFGIAVVEAMAAGCVPVVYKDGGAWYDVVSKVSSELGYRRIEEAANIVRRLDEDKELYSKLRERSIEVSKFFNYDNFKKIFLEKVEYVLRVKRIAFTSSNP